MKLTGLSLGVQGLSEPSGISQPDVPQSQQGLGKKGGMRGRGMRRRGRGERGTLGGEKRREMVKRNLQKNPSLFLLSAVPKRSSPPFLLPADTMEFILLSRKLFCSARSSSEECGAGQQSFTKLLSCSSGSQLLPRGF